MTIKALNNGVNQFLAGGGDWRVTVTLRLS
jgi:hypothetical protein